MYRVLQSIIVNLIIHSIPDFRGHTVSNLEHKYRNIDFESVYARKNVVTIVNIIS